MLIETITVPMFYRSLLGGNPRYVVLLAGGMMLAAAVATLFVRPSPAPGRTICK